MRDDDTPAAFQPLPTTLGSYFSGGVCPLCGNTGIHVFEVVISHDRRKAIRNRVIERSQFCGCRDLHIPAVWLAYFPVYREDKP